MARIVTRDWVRGRLARLLSAQAGRLARLPFARHPALRIACDVQGYRDHVFGGRAGPDSSFWNVCHELGHAAEFGPGAFSQRCVEGAFVFHLPWVDIGAGYGPVCEPETSQATQRECRAIGLQWHLLDAAGVRQSTDAFLAHVVSIASFMPDHLYSWGGMRRDDAIKSLVIETREGVRAAEVFDRIVGWLDLVALDLAQDREDLDRPAGISPGM